MILNAHPHFAAVNMYYTSVSGKCIISQVKFKVRHNAQNKIVII